jgi:hypothetical protein
MEYSVGTTVTYEKQLSEVITLSFLVATKRKNKVVSTVYEMNSGGPTARFAPGLLCGGLGLEEWFVEGAHAVGAVGAMTDSA